MFKRFKEGQIKTRVRREQRTFLQNNEAEAYVTPAEQEAWDYAMQKDVFEIALGRMRTHVGSVVQSYTNKYPDRTVSEICSLVSNHHPAEVREGMGDLLPENIHRVIWAHVENTLIAELVTRARIATLLATLK